MKAGTNAEYLWRALSFNLQRKRRLVWFEAMFYSYARLQNSLRWVLGGGVGVPCTVNPLYDGPKAGAEALKAADAFIPEAKTIRPLGLAVVRRLS